MSCISGARSRFGRSGLATRGRATRRLIVGRDVRGDRVNATFLQKAGEASLTHRNVAQLLLVGVFHFGLAYMVELALAICSATLVQLRGGTISSTRELAIVAIGARLGGTHCSLRCLSGCL